MKSKITKTFILVLILMSVLSCSDTNLIGNWKIEKVNLNFQLGDKPFSVDPRDPLGLGQNPKVDSQANILKSSLQSRISFKGDNTYTAEGFEFILPLLIPGWERRLDLEGNWNLKDDTLFLKDGKDGKLFNLKFHIISQKGEQLHIQQYGINNEEENEIWLSRE